MTYQSWQTTLNQTRQVLNFYHWLGHLQKKFPDFSPFLRDTFIFPSGALLKACFCFLDIVTLPSSETLSEQLSRKYQAGFELHTWSTAPQGSGLGTSSILAGVILAALLRVTGRTASMNSLVHAVLIIEQMLTTGGGWQDNAGGLLPGFKMTRSQASLPLKVEVETLNLPQATVEDMTQRLICVYSGKPRLAKNLLQVKKFSRHQ